jgi:hypothetical protein
MNYYADFDPYLIRERNEGLMQEMSTWRLEKWPHRRKWPVRDEERREHVME